MREGTDVTRIRRRLLTAAAVAGLPLAVLPAATNSVGAQAAGLTRQIPAGGAGGFTAASSGTSAAVEAPETPGLSADGGVLANRSRSGAGATAPVGAVSQPRNVTTSSPGLLTSFQGIDHYTQRFGTSAGRNQFSLEPPDQGLCSNGSTVLEVVNDTLALYDTSGNSLATPQALNGFLNYAPALNRSAKPPVQGPFVTDPSCLYDAATGHWFVDVLTLDLSAPDAQGKQAYTGTNHLDIAVNNSSDLVHGGWTVYRIPVQDDGTLGTPNHHCNPGSGPQPAGQTHHTACFGDYPHIGADANGFYITTNEYDFFGNGFHGAQVYAISKSQLAARPSAITVTQFDTHGGDPFGFASNGFTLAPSTTPGGGGDPAANGTEHFLSSNAAAEAHDPGDGSSSAHASTQVLSWALTNTAALNGGAGTLALTPSLVPVSGYAPPPASEQKSGNAPLHECLDNNRCAGVLIGGKDPYTEKLSTLDSNDSRMMQTTWVGGQLWGALDTAVAVSSAKQAGIEWFDIASAGNSLTNAGYVALGNDDLIYPAIGLTSGGTGVMAFTVTGSDYYPSAGYATVTPSGVGDIHLAAAGQGPDDGFTGTYYYNDGAIRPRWGDYGAAVAVGNDIWIASEYIAQACDLSTYMNTAFRCGNTRTALANWSTRISEVAAP